MTVAVLGIAIALPAGLQLMLKNANTISAGWDGTSRISLYLKSDLSDDQARDLLRRVEIRLDVEEATMIDKDQALEEFQALSGLGDALVQLDDNPLPVVIEILPTAQFSSPQSSQAMLETFRMLPEVDMAKLDLQWVKRLYYLLELVDRFIFALAAMLGLAVLLIVGNTIRLAIQNRREEIEIIKLIGATDAFIRRPFLYTGLWYGLGGGLFALMLISAALFWLTEPVNQLAIQYNSGYFLQGLNISEVFQLMTFSCVLGLVGSWISVSRHLKQINPQ
jgi:cell division transport system permease protein